MNNLDLRTHLLSQSCCWRVSQRELEAGGVSSHLWPWTNRGKKQRHIYDSNSTCVTQPAVLKWNQAHVLDRDSEIFSCPGGETCWELSISWLGSILETLDLAIVTPHARSTPTCPEGERERDRETETGQCSVPPHKEVFTISRLAHKAAISAFIFITKAQEHPPNTGVTFFCSGAHVLCAAGVRLKNDADISTHICCMWLVLCYLSLLTCINIWVERH